MPQLRETGRFRAEILDYSFQEAKESAAISIVLAFKICEKFEGETWQTRKDDSRVYGNVWIVKRDSTINQQAQQNLMESTGWDGEIESILSKTWKPWPCQISVEENLFQRKVSYRVSWINHWDSEPTAGLRQLDNTAKTSLKNKYSAQLRASAAAITKQLGKVDETEKQGKEEMPF